MRWAFLFALLTGVSASGALSGPYSPPPGQPGSAAIPYYVQNGTPNEDPRILGWASQVTELKRGPEIITKPDGFLAAWGTEADVLGAADAYGSDNFNVLSLGDGGSITLKFPVPIGNGPGPDLAVFENAFSDSFLELAFVEVSSNGVTFHRFPAISLTQTDTQIGGFGLLDTTYIHNLAGKYRSGFGTPFDLAELAGIDDLDIGLITHVRIVDVIGSIDPIYGSRDSQGNLINDPWSTEWEAGGFDLDAVAYLNVMPEPASALTLAAGTIVILHRRRRRA
jgi:hypothetical protein